MLPDFSKQGCSRFPQVFLTEDGLHLAIVMEYVEGTTLLDHVNSYGKLEEDEAR